MTFHDLYDFIWGQSWGCKFRGDHWTFSLSVLRLPVLACPLLWDDRQMAGPVKVHFISGLIKFCFEGDVSYLGGHRFNGFFEVFQVVMMII